MFEWSDIRIFQAVASEGSTLAGARKLGINQSTVSRRIRALERSLGLSLFDRDTRGYALTPQGSALVAAARKMAVAAENLDLTAERLRRDLSGTIRLSGAAMSMNTWGFPLIARFRAIHPEITFDVDSSETQISLEDGAADLALRATDQVTGDTLVARRVGDIPWGIYASRAYLATHAAPQSVADCADRDFLYYDETMVEKVGFIKWFGQQIDPGRIILRVNSVSGMVGSVGPSNALGLLPCPVADSSTDLVCCFRDPLLAHPLWIVASKESHTQTRVRSFMKFVAENIRDMDDAAGL